jgi:ubiquinone/menaquinone biosynthesis C-methylase UbiE
MRTVFKDNDLYLDGEEKFGRLASRLYSFSSYFLRSFHEFVSSDILSLHPSSVLDIGCGSGDVLANLASKKSGIELYGIDPSPFMIRIAEKRIKKRADIVLNGKKLEERLHLSVGSNRRIPFDSDKFGVICSSLSFHHWKERETSLPTILERLSDRGAFVIYEYSKGCQKSLLRRWLSKKHAISVEDTQRLGLEGYTKTVQIIGPYVKVMYMQSTPNFGAASASETSTDPVRTVL